MKKVYSLILGGLVFSTAALAQDQYDLEVSLTSPASASNVAPGSITVTYDITNIGPGAVPGDLAIWLTYLIGDNNFGWDGTAQQVDGIGLPASGLPADQTIPSSLLQTVLYDGAPLVFDATAIATATEGCVWVIGVDEDGSTIEDMAMNGDPGDADNMNNIDCFVINPAFASIVEMSISESVDVKVLTESLEVTSTSIDAFDYVIYSLNGQTVDNGTIKGNTTISTSSFENGAYVLFIHNNTEKKVVKFAVAK